MAKNILSMGQQNQRTVPSYPAIPYQAVPANQQIVLWQPQQQIQQNTKPWNEILPVEQWLRDFANKPNSSSVFPARDGATYAQMLQNNPIKPNKPEMKITEKGRKLCDELDEILHRKTKFSPEILDLYSGHGPNPELDNLNNWYRDLQQADNVVTNDKLEALTGKVDDIAQNVDKLKRGMGEANGKIIGKINGLTNKVDDVAQNVAGLSGKVDGLTTWNTQELR